MNTTNAMRTKRYLDFHIGQKVLLNIPANANTGSNELKKFNNQEYLIERIHLVPSKMDIIITLKGVKSKLGVPFSIAKEWCMIFGEADEY